MSRQLKTLLVLGCVAFITLWLLTHRSPSPSPTLEASSGRTRSADMPASQRSPEQSGDDVAPSNREPLSASSNPADVLAESPVETETLVQGTLLGAEGKPIANPESAWVSFVGIDGNRFEVDMPRRQNTYSIQRLPFGQYSIQARVDGYRTLDETFRLERAHPQVKKDLQFVDSTVLSVFVHSPDGRNLCDVVMERVRPPPGIPDLTTLPLLIPIATRTNPGAWIPEVIGSANNFFGVGHFMQYGSFSRQRKDGSVGVLIVDIDLPVYASLVDCHSVLRTQRVDPGADEVDFVIPADAMTANAAALTLRVLDVSTKAPVSRASASLTGGTGGCGGRADSEGRITASGCRPGFFHMFVCAEGYESLMMGVRLDAAKTTELGEILLGRGIKLQLRVLSPDEKPCQTVFGLGVVDPATSKIEMDQSNGWFSNEQGELELPALGRRLYVLRTRMGDPQRDEPVSGNVLIDLRAGVLPPTQEIHLQRGSRLTLRANAPGAEEASFRVMDRQGLEVVTDRFFGSAPALLLLPKGSYQVSLIDPGGDVVTTKSVELGAEPMTCDLRN